MGIWVDTDMGFDDIWALFILRAHDVSIDGVSLVAGNAPLQQVIKNALGATQAFNFSWPLFEGAKAPLVRQAETAARILGARGMCSRNRHLPEVSSRNLPVATEAISRWLFKTQPDHHVLALGPLTNLATLAIQSPDTFKRITQITWMGGSSGRGNHSQYAEFNALADAEAFATLLGSGVQLRIVDLEICRKVTFGTDDLPAPLAPLVDDLLKGYLDIALTRGRASMAIYDPLAALSLAHPDALVFEPKAVAIDTHHAATYGMTRFFPDANSTTTLAVHAGPQCAATCLEILKDVSISD